jgi:hypothetical protein
MTSNYAEIKIVLTMVILIVTMSIFSSGDESSIDRCSANTKTGAASASATVGEEDKPSITCSIQPAFNTTVRDNVID